MQIFDVEGFLVAISGFFAHGSFADDVQSALRHNREDVHFSTDVVIEFLDALDGLFVEDVDEAVENVEVECRRQ